MLRRFRVQIWKSNNLIVLIHNFSRNFTLSDFAKNTISHNFSYETANKLSSLRNKYKVIQTASIGQGSKNKGW